MECVGIFIAIVVLAILVWGGLGIAYYQAKKAYYSSLEQLKSEPHNPDLRQQTLTLGRKFADAAKSLHSIGWKDAIMLDEAAFSNDINAACARAGSRVTIEADASKGTPESRLAMIDELRGKGLITDPEYQSRRKQILDEL